MADNEELGVREYIGEWLLIFQVVCVGDAVCDSVTVDRAFALVHEHVAVWWCLQPKDREKDIVLT